MSKYGNLSDEERRRLHRQFTEAARDIEGSGLLGSPGEAEKREQPQDLGFELAAAESRETLPARRPAYRVRRKVDAYAYAQGFQIAGLTQFLAGLFSFLNPSGPDLVHPRFVRALVRDDPYRADPSGYSLMRTLVELRKAGQALLKGGFFLRRSSDRRLNVGAELQRDVALWEPFGHRVLRLFQHVDRGTLEALESVRGRFEAQQRVDVLDLEEVVKGVYRAVLRVNAPLGAVREHVQNVGELVTAVYRRIYPTAEKLRQVSVRIDNQVEEFLGSFQRLKWFAHQLYPALLKMLNLFREEEQIQSIAPELFAFVGLDRREVVTARPAKRPPAPASKPAPAPSPGPEQAEEPGSSVREEYKGILTILEYAFPGSRLELIDEGDFSSLFWFHQRIFSHGELRGPLVPRRSDLLDLLWKMPRSDPLAMVVVLHELVRQMLDCVDAEAFGKLVDPLKASPPKVAGRLVELREQWLCMREELLLRYLKELDYFEKETAADDRMRTRFLQSAAGRKTVETMNQIRNHVIRGYGHTVVGLDRKEYFRCQPLFTLTGDLYDLLRLASPERSQLEEGNPIPRARLEQARAVHFQPTAAIRQIQAYIDAVPAEKRHLDSPVGETNRQFLEILTGTVDLLHHLVNDPVSPLRAAGGEVRVADARDRSLRQDIEQEQTPLRVELKKDFEETDRLTGLVAKNGYLESMPELFRRARRDADELTMLLLDLDHFKAVNDALGHEAGDAMLGLAGQAVRACVRREDLAVRFGGEELLVVMRAGQQAALQLAERIRRTYGELLRGAGAPRAAEIPEIMAHKEMASRGRHPDQAPAEHAELLRRWRDRPLGTLSIGIAQGLGPGLLAPCADEKQLFRRADKMLYLAKDGGRNRTVMMVDELRVPLLEAEYRDFQEYRQENPEAYPDSYLALREADGSPLDFQAYPYERYAADESFESFSESGDRKP